MQFFWEKDLWEETDRHLQKVREMPFQRQFPFIPTDFGLYIIRGPRQVGKSSWLKTILSHYAKMSRCFYLSCEEVQDFRELGEILRSVRGYDIILLDEVSFVDEWSRAVKHAIDAGDTKIIVVTGSHAVDLKQGADRMPGRFDGGGEFVLLPMDFDEFVAARMQAGWSSSNRLEELKAYMRVGGFPTAVAEGGSQAKLPRKAIDTYWRWLAGDATKLGKNEALLTELLIQLAITLQTPVSFNTLAKKTSIGSHNTIREYITILEGCFALRTLHAIDIDTNTYRTRKDRKFYFLDPLLYWLALQLSGASAPSDVEARLAEMVANEHLARRFKRFGYFQNSKGEIDFVSPENWAVEVKWAPVATRLSKSYLDFISPRKLVWTQSNFLQEWP